MCKFRFAGTRTCSGHLPERASILELISESQWAGSSQKRACSLIGISDRTFQHWSLIPGQEDLRQSPNTIPAHILTDDERCRIIEISSSKEFRDKSPIKSCQRSQIEANLWRLKRAIYSENGLLLRSSKPYFSGEAPKYWTNFAYDGRNRQRLVTLPDGSSQEFQYEGLRTIVKDSLGRSTVYDKDARGLLLAVTNPKGEVLKYAYDSAGKPVSITDAGGNITTMAYDIFGRRVSSIDPTTGLSTKVPNVLGLAASQSRQDIKVTGKFDALGRTLEKTMAMAGEPDRVERFTYDEGAFGFGQLSKASGPDSIISYTYDSLSLPVETVQNLLGKPYVSSTEYDAVGRVSRQTYPSGFAINYIYDEVSQLTEVRNQLSGKALWALGELYPSGDIKAYRLGNGARGYKTLNEKNDRLLSESVAGVDQTLQIARSYEHDAVGNLLSRKDNVS